MSATGAGSDEVPGGPASSEPAAPGGEEAFLATAGVFGLVIRRPVATSMAFVTLLTFGWVSLQGLPLSLLPDISYPSVTVRAEYPGAAPEDVEERVTKRLHEALSVLGRLESISSVTRAGLVDVTLEFAWGTPLTYAIQDIRERLDRAILPLEVGTPLVLRYDPTLDPILVVGLIGGRDLVELRRLAEDHLALALSTVEGVAAVRVRGGLEDEIQVRLKPDRLGHYGLRPSDVAARIASENVNMASGTVLEGDTEYLVRILNEYLSTEEIGRTIVRREGDSIVRLSDLADVRRTTKERDVITRIDGSESVELQIYKEADVNLVALAQRVRTSLFGSQQQRRWVEQLRRGERKDPDQAMEAFLVEVDKDGAKRAAMARIEGAGKLAGGDPPGGRRGGGPQGGRGDRGPGAASGEGPPAPDVRTPEEKVLDEELSRRLAELRSEQADKDAAFAYLAADLPADVTVHLLSDQSRFIESALREVNSSALQGALLAVLVLYFFLARIGPTLIIALSIPVSVIVTFVFLKTSGTSLNVMSLGGLALGIGMVVDNAIVVLESIARHREEGSGRIAAAVKGTRELAAAATASTLTTVAVFAPIVFVEGIAGQVFRDQALTVVASLCVSLVVALSLVPMLATWGSFGEGRRLHLAAPLLRGWQLLAGPLRSWQGLRARFGGGRWRSSWRAVLAAPVHLLVLLLQLLAEVALGRVLGVALGLLATLGVLALAALAAAFVGLLWVPTTLFRAVYDRVERLYPAAIARLVRSSTAMSAVVLGALGLLWWMIGAAGSLGSELLPEVHQGEIIGRLALPVGTPLETTDQLALAAEEVLRDDPRVAWNSSTVGVPRDEISQPDEGEHTARLSIGLHPSEDMAAVEEAVMARLRAALQQRPELRDVRFERPTLFSVRSPIVVEIKGESLREIAEAATEVETFLRSIPGLSDVRSSVQPGSPEIMLSFDRDLLSRYGLDTRQVADVVSDMVKGRVATRFTDADHKLDVLVAVHESDLRSVEDLLALPANPTSEASEPLAALGMSRVREGPREIRRIWGQRAAVVSASLTGFDIGRASERILEGVQDIERTKEVVIGLGGQGREMGGALGQMRQALLLAIFLVYVVMASIFESLLQPLIILLTIPLALVGAVAALWALDIPLSVVVFIGGIILAGIVVNNAIVLIDAINRRRRIDGLPLVEAVRIACHHRLRPILMTTLTTVLGLLPLTGWLPLTGGEGAELRAPMAITVVAGLSFATLLTLVIIPTIYVLVERGLERLRGRAVEAHAGAR